MLEKSEISLRSLEKEDVDFLLNLENDTSIWEVSRTVAPFTKEEIADYISNAKQDIIIAEQYRIVINLKGVQIGCIHLYEYNCKEKKVG